MESLKRKPDLEIKGTLNLDKNTRIDIIGLSVRKLNEINNNKRLSDDDRAAHYIAARMLVNGEPIVFDDLLDCFSDSEYRRIANFVEQLETENKDDSKNV